jgi:hypothetical protein
LQHIGFQGCASILAASRFIAPADSEVEAKFIEHRCDSRVTRKFSEKSRRFSVKFGRFGYPPTPLPSDSDSLPAPC